MFNFRESVHRGPILKNRLYKNQDYVLVNTSARSKAFVMVFIMLFYDETTRAPCYLTLSTHIKALVT